MSKKRPSNLDKYEEMEDDIRRWQQENPKATLTEIEKAVEAELAELRVAIVERLAQE